MTELVYIGLGSNLGDRETALLSAVEWLGRIDGGRVLGHSSLYESAPIGPPQPRYLNAVVEMECALVPPQLLAIVGQIEIELGRKQGTRWGPRAIDLDILLWGTRVVADENLQIPHASLHERRFALEPLCELNPGAVHPIFGQTVAHLLANVRRQDVVKFSSAEWRNATCARHG